MNQRVFVFVVLLLTCSAKIFASPTYHLTDLGTLGGPNSSAYGINNSGQIVGESNTGSGTDAFLYSDGSMHDLGTLGSTDDSHATAINSAGQAAGYSYITDGGGNAVAHAFLYSNGKMNDLGTLGGESAFAYGINSTGQVVGYSARFGHIFLYSNGSIQDLGIFGGSGGVAEGINSSGKLVGYSYSSSDPRVRSFIFDTSNGTTTDLGTLGGNYTQAHAINDSGEVVGDDRTSDNAAYPYHAFLYSDGMMTDLGTLVGNNSSADGINNVGQAVGYSIISGNLQHAFLYTEGIMLDLNTLVENPMPGWTITHALGINDSGSICGNITDAQGDTHAILLTPIPEPTGLAFVAILGIIPPLSRRPRV